jgi:hypothetical protein
MFDQVASFEHGNLGCLRPDAHGHQVPAHRPTIALTTFSTLERLVVEFGTTSAKDRLDRALVLIPSSTLVRRALALLTGTCSTVRAPAMVLRALALTALTALAARSLATATATAPAT